MNLSSQLAFIFPGQGSQKVGMLADIAEKHDCVAQTFAQASEFLSYDLWSLVQDGPEEQLAMTEVTQPALLASSVAIFRAWQQNSDVMPSFVAGHSLGEWSALVSAGVVSFDDAIRLVKLRGKYMQEAVPVGVGAMAAIIGIDDPDVEAVCDEVSETLSQVVSPVNYNSPGQLVIAGEKDAVELAIEKVKLIGAKKAVQLPVSAPFHTRLMAPAAQRLAAEIGTTEFNAPAIPIMHNVTADTEHNPGKIKDLMIEQIYSPVRWVECVQSLVNRGVTHTFECGPGKVLSGLNRRIDKSIKSYSSTHSEALETSLKEINTLNN